MGAENAIIRSVRSFDARYTLPEGAGSDAIHSNPQYCLAVTLLQAGQELVGTAIVLTLGEGNRIVCELIELLAGELVGKEIEELMSGFGAFLHRTADHPHLRWLGPHKGAVHLALASITNACFDLWAKVRGVPLWRLLLDLTPEQMVRLLDLSYLEDILTEADAHSIVEQHQETRKDRDHILKSGYPGYDTSVGWFGYDDETVRDKARQAMDR